MRTHRIPAFLLAFAAVASVGNLYGQQTKVPGINQRDAAATTTRPDANPQMQSGGVPLTQALVHKLQKANDGEIELANLALQRADNKEVQQFATMIVKDHQAFNQKLQGMGGDTATRTTREGRAITTSDTPATRDDASNNRPRNNANRKTNSANDNAANTANNSTAESPAATDQRSDTQSSAERRQRNRNGSESVMVPQQLTRIMDQACDTSLKMTKEMLEKYQGQDFAMAYLGQQCVAHTMLLAELQAIQSQGPEELKSVAQEAAGKVQQHLEHAKQLAKKLEDDRKTKPAAAR